MPTYEYRCKACRHELDAYQSIMDKALRVCPACGKHKLERLISGGVGVIFKGSGFYQTDYRSDSYKKGAKREKDAASPPAPAADKAVPAADKAAPAADKAAPAAQSAPAEKK
ncbi:MAG: zinc ribbon domain-containing protein [Planctomycetota bacterium]